MTFQRFMTSRGVLPVALAVTAFFTQAGEARAEFVLTEAALKAGFTVSTFADKFPNSSSIGPLGITFTPEGGVLVSDLPGNVRLFAHDTDGQHAPDAPVGQNYGFDGATALLHSGESYFMTEHGTGKLVAVDGTGMYQHDVVTGLSLPLGLVTNPDNGHLFVVARGTNQIYDVDPVAKTKSVFINSVPTPDGLSIAPDGKTIYVAAVGAGGGGHILGYDVATKGLVFDSGPISSVDGTAVGTGPLAGNIFANTNDGRLVEVNLTTGVQTLFGSGGSRGDFVAVDPNDGSLLLTQTDSILRIHGFTAVPEPGCLALAATGAAALLVCARRRRAARPVGA